MKVVKLGPEYRRTTECTKCGSILEYTPNDVITYEVHHPDSVSCPMCGKSLVVIVPESWWPFVYKDVD